MFKVTGVLLLSFVAVISAASINNVLKESKGGRIAGGERPNEDVNMPYQVALFTARDDIYYCGGSILNRRWIVTSGVCAIGKSPADVIVFVGSDRLSVGGQRHVVDRIVLHPNFDVSVYANDVAVMRVWIPFAFNENVQPIAMRAEPVVGEAEALISGFGRQTISDSTTPDLLRFLRVNLISNEECADEFDDAYTERLFDNTVCSAGVEGRGTCIGDAGGPLVHDGELIGVISWGVPCGLGLPDVYARISNHRGWILVHTMLPESVE
ncbi:chymotrypsin-2-like [Uranotaenia lowii]|uniref:chymotrypsin-2-like n=1 Tax=Uranotaenia lowii TaxID=190385 RepID=UPI00247971AF|nr:chymotrypsin-2-like [Uranotaenia lowii]